jgi:hypothetical protein
VLRWGVCMVSLCIWCGDSVCVPISKMRKIRMVARWDGEELK